MKHTAIAAKLRVTATEMEAVAALGEDIDYPVEFVPSFIVNWVANPSMFSALLIAQAIDKSLPVRSDK